MKIQKAVQEYCFYLQNIKLVSQEHIKKTIRALKLLSCLFKKNSCVSDINLKKINEFRVLLNKRKGYKSKFICQNVKNSYLIIIRSFLKYFFLYELDENILFYEKIELAKKEPTHIKNINLDDLNKLRNIKLNCDKRTHLRDVAIIEMLFSTGLRISELCSLNCDDIDLKSREFSVIGKGKKLRLCFLSEKAAIKLKNYLKIRLDKKKPLFISFSKNEKFNNFVSKKRLSRLSRQMIAKILKKRAEIAGINYSISPHKLRHTFATTLLRNGANLRLVQKLLGHANISSTQIYTHYANPELKKAHSKYLYG